MLCIPRYCTQNCGSSHYFVQARFVIIYVQSSMLEFCCCHDVVLFLVPHVGCWMSDLTSWSDVGYYFLFFGGLAFVTLLCGHSTHDLRDAKISHPPGLYIPGLLFYVTVYVIIEKPLGGKVDSCFFHPLSMMTYIVT